MRDASCRREDIIVAFEELCHRLESRRSTLWRTYGDATKDLPHRHYTDIEAECWYVLKAGLAGIDAERQMLQRDFEHRLALLDDTEAVA